MERQKRKTLDSRVRGNDRFGLFSCPFVCVHSIFCAVGNQIVLQHDEIRSHGKKKQPNTSV